MNKYLVITGASRGIGYSTAEYYVQQGWNVINLSRTPCDLAVENITVDFSDKNWQAHCDKKLANLLKGSDKISLVHNTGVCLNDTIRDFDENAIRIAFDINIVTPMLLNRLILPFMTEGSSIIYIGSTLSEKAVPGCASYSTSKHAIAGLMKATCQDLAGMGIHTCCVCPGITNTTMLQERVKHTPGLLETLTAISTAKRLIEPEEIAELIHFCSQHPIINGATIHGNLGQIEK